MAQGKMNWTGLSGYVIQPSDMDLFQTYMSGLTKAYITGTRTKGMLFGGRISVVSGMQLQVSAGLAIMPDGQLVSFPQANFVISSADTTNPRIDRIELSYSPTNNSTVIAVNGVSEILDITYNPSINVISGTPSGSPIAPAATSTNLSLGLISVAANQAAILTGNISQVEDIGFITSAIQLGNQNSFIRFNQSISALQFSNDGVRYSSLGSGGGGGGGGANWVELDGLAPVVAFENGEKAFLFSQGASQEVSLYVRVPSGYLPGSPIKMKLAHYSPDSSLNYKFSASANLVRKNIDPISSTTNRYASTNGDVVNSIANLYTEVTYDLSSSAGAINGVAISPGDLLLVQLQRVAPAGSEAASDVRMIPSSTEILFS